MTTPSITGYSRSSSSATSGLPNTSNFVMAMYGSTLYIYDFSLDRLHRLLGDNTFDTGIYSSFTPGVSSAQSMGISPDGSTLVFGQNGSSNLFTINTATGTKTTYSGGNNTTVNGNIYVQNNTTFYTCQTNNRNPIRVVLNTSNNTYSFSDQCQSTGTLGCWGCTLLGTDDLLFVNNDNAGTVNVYKCSLSTQGQAPVALSGINSPTVVSINPFDIFAINGVQANSTTYNFFFIGTYSGTSLYQYTVSGSVATLVGTLGLSTSRVNNITGSDLSGNQDGNMRLFISNGTTGFRIIDKAYNNSGTTGPTGVSTGGDPHTGTLTGKSVIIVRDTPFEYLDTHPLRENSVFNEKDKIRTYIECDCFSLKKEGFAFSESTSEKDDFADQIEENHLKELITNLDDSYLKYVSILFGNISLRINMITLLLDDEGDSLTEEGERNKEGKTPGKGRNQTNFGEEKEYSLRTENDEGRITFSKILLFEPGSVELKSKYARRSAYLKREVKIITREYTLSLQLTRTECIHLSDMYLEIEGERDPFSFGGVIVDGEVKTPIHFSSEE